MPGAAGESMTVPEDAGQVMTAMKLGWFIAEVRGRNRPDAPRGTKVRPPGPPGHALPLRIEQTSTELRIEAQAVLGAMARGLGVNSGGANQASYSQAIDAQAEALAQARAGGAAARVAATPNGAAQAGAPGPGAAAAPDGEAAPGAAARRRGGCHRDRRSGCTVGCPAGADLQVRRAHPGHPRIGVGHGRLWLSTRPRPGRALLGARSSARHGQEPGRLAVPPR